MQSVDVHTDFWEPLDSEAPYGHSVGPLDLIQRESEARSGESHGHQVDLLTDVEPKRRSSLAAVVGSVAQFELTL